MTKKEITAIVASILIGLTTVCLPACDSEPEESADHVRDETVPDRPPAEVFEEEQTPPTVNQDKKQEMLERGREREDL